MQEAQNPANIISPEKESQEENNENGILLVLIHELRRDLGPALKEIKVKDVRIVSPILESCSLMVMEA